MDAKTIMLVMLMIACIGISEYQINKPVKLTKDVLIHPSVVLKRIFMSGGYTRPEKSKSAVKTNVEKVSEGSIKMVSRGVPREVDTSFKSYMGYKSITSKSSDQWKLQQLCTTDSQGFRKYENDFYVVAMGHYYSHKVGAKFAITFDTGNQIKVIVGDVKMRQHTNDTFQYVESNGNVIEFIVNTKKISKLIKDTGDVSNSGNGLMKGKILKIEEIMEE